MDQATAPAVPSPARALGRLRRPPHGGIGRVGGSLIGHAQAGASCALKAHCSWPFGKKIGHGDPAYFVAVDVNGGFFTRPVIDSALVVPDGSVGVGVHLDPTIAEVDDPVNG